MEVEQLIQLEGDETVQDAANGADPYSEPVDVPAEQPAVEDSVVKLYFVRIPRPPLDDAERQRLQQEFQAQLTELKGINARLAAKRDVVKTLRSQMLQAKSLKGSAQPEFEDKLNRLKQLRDLRQTYIADVASIKNKVKGLECRTEQELDAKIKQEEERIRFGSVTLREEKNIVNEISKLRAQRDRIKEYELEKSRLVELESNIAKVKAATEDLESEFSIIKGERDAAKEVMDNFYNQLKAAEKEASKVEEEQRDSVEKKNEAHEALEAAKREVDASMHDYRENRKFSLQIRDMVANGEVEAAQELCFSQVEDLLGRLLTDTVFRADYHKVLADQRRFPVSDLLPESSTAAAAAAAAAGPASKQAGKGAKGAATAAAAVPIKLVARGKEKAQELIASIMQSASAEAEKRRLAAPQADDDVGGDEPEAAAAAPEAVPRAAAPAKPAAPVKHVDNPSAKAAEVFKVNISVPKVEEEVFVPPVHKVEAETMSKEQIREEQRLKAAEAEARKKKRQEATDKKRVKAVELQKKAEEDERIARARAAQEVKAPAPEPEPEEETVTVTERTAPAKEMAAAPSKQAAAPVVPKPLLGPAAKRPISKNNLMRKLKKFYQANQQGIVIAAVLALIIVILIAASFY